MSRDLVDGGCLQRVAVTVRTCQGGKLKAGWQVAGLDLRMHEMEEGVHTGKASAAMRADRE